MTTICLKHSDPRDTSVMRPQDAPCSCDLAGGWITSFSCRTDNHSSCSYSAIKGDWRCLCDCHREPIVSPVDGYDFMDHLRVFYPAEYKRRTREASK